MFDFLVNLNKHLLKQKYNFKLFNLHMNTENVDILIIGAGPSGSVAAGYLQKQGAKIKVVEKQKFPRVVVGESLIARVMDQFEEAGLSDALNSYKFEKTPGARFIRGEQMCIFDFSNKFGEGWDWTWQIPRADFDKAMTDELQRKGVDIAFETEVIDVEFNGTDSVTTIKDKEGNLLFEVITLLVNVLLPVIVCAVSKVT